MWKCVVALLFALDSLTSAFAAHALYTYFVLNFGENPVADLIIPWSLSTEKLLVTLITFVAQCFYANTIWKVTVSKTITFSIFFLALASLALGIVTTVDIFTIRGVIGTPRFSIISGFVQGLAALDDLLITAAMCYYLTYNRSGLPSTNQFVDTLILYTMSRGILTATTQILFLITVRSYPSRLSNSSSIGTTERRAPRKHLLHPVPHVRRQIIRKFGSCHVSLNLMGYRFVLSQ
ncbi:hypothetical protein B0H12DRAFT_1083901 [Mycena haematopus]|nr:hypothetical protein B0H12DRAFT_1083901 [Mycena haematopus]